MKAAAFSAWHGGILANMQRALAGSPAQCDCLLPSARRAHVSFANLQRWQIYMALYFIEKCISSVPVQVSVFEAWCPCRCCIQRLCRQLNLRSVVQNMFCADGRLFVRWTAATCTCTVTVFCFGYFYTFVGHGWCCDHRAEDSNNTARSPPCLADRIAQIQCFSCLICYRLLIS